MRSDFGFHPGSGAINSRRMNHPLRRTAAILLLLQAAVAASPAEAERIRKSWDLRMETWSLETRAATTPEARAKAAAARPDIGAAVKEMWAAIGTSLDQEWAIEPAAWFIRATPGLVTTGADGANAPAYAAEVEAIRKAVETRHLKSAKLAPMCMALVALPDPRSLALLEKIQQENPDPKVQGVAALANAMALKGLGDDGEIMRKRLTCLRSAIIQSSDVAIGSTTVAKLAEDELYIIRYLTKGREAPDLTGVDSGGRPLKLSDFKGKVIYLIFWSGTMQEADRVVQMTRDTIRKFEGKSVVVLGVNQDPLERLRSLEADGTIPWRNFSDTTNQLARDFRVGTLPLVYVLDGERRIHFAGSPGSFAELTAEALISEEKPAEP